MTEQQKFTVKTRYVFFTMADWRAFSDALVGAYPQARYNIRPTHKIGPERPHAIWDRYLMDVPRPGKDRPSQSDDTIMVFDPDWQPEYQTFRFDNDPPDVTRWGREKGAPMPFVKFRRYSAPTADELEMITIFGSSEINYFCPADDKPAAAEMRRFFKLLGKFCTNRNQAYYHLPSLKFLRTEAKGSWYWLGHDAIRWVREHPQRMLQYVGGYDWGIRPCTEEEMAALAAQLPPAQES